MDAHEILNVLSKQKFADWYKSTFQQYLIDNSISKENIIEDIRTLFKIEPTFEDYWKPLLKVIDIKDIGDYTWMGLRGNSHHIYLYKNYNTRKYINVDENGNCFSYNREQYMYTSISKEEAIKHVLS